LFFGRFDWYHIHQWRANQKELNTMEVKNSSSTNSLMTMKVNHKQQQQQQHGPSLSSLLSLSSTSPIVAGLIYFCIVFGIAFVLGAVRVLVLVPRIGELYAVLIETPIILTISWMTMTWIVRLKQPQQQQCDTNVVIVQNRIVTGLVAFFFLMIAEWLLSVVVFNKTTAEFLEELTSSRPQIIGLLGQVAYGLFPVMEWWILSRTPSPTTTTNNNNNNNNKQKRHEM
jgi:hypothetical protein